MDNNLNNENNFGNEEVLISPSTRVSEPEFIPIQPEQPIVQPKKINKIWIFGGVGIVLLALLSVLVIILLSNPSTSDEGEEGVEIENRLNTHIPVSSAEGIAISENIEKLFFTQTTYNGNGNDSFVYKAEDMNGYELIATAFMSVCSGEKTTATIEEMNQSVAKVLPDFQLSMDSFVYNSNGELFYGIVARNENGILNFYNGCDRYTYSEKAYNHIEEINFRGDDLYVVIVDRAYLYITGELNEFNEEIIQLFTNENHDQGPIQITNSEETIDWNIFPQYKYYFKKVGDNFIFQKLEKSL